MKAVVRSITTVEGLIDAALVPEKKRAALQAVAARYAVSVSPAMLSLMGAGAEGIARQFIPSTDELIETVEERADPIGDGAHSPVPGIVHRHRDRALFLPTLACAVYCRFCFRREAVGGAGSLDAAALETALAYIAAHDEIWEVVVTGGDPFSLSPRRIGEIVTRLAAIDHVRVVRWHTRVPSVAPEHISAEFVDALCMADKTVVVSLHADHPSEFTEAARGALRKLSQAGFLLVSQSVLLAGINDDIDTLEALMRALLQAGVKPYYLHHPDLARGTSHFRVSVDHGLELMRQLRARASGLAIPQYVLDIPGGFAKVPLDSSSVVKTDTGWRIRDHAGVWHPYP
ncbi:MAG: lysine-2,3-aminomutase-like protein [Rhizomicrobium sp.]